MVFRKYLSMSFFILTALSIRSMEQKQPLSGSNSTTETCRPTYPEVATGLKPQPVSGESLVPIEVVAPVEHIVLIGETITLELPEKIEIVSQEVRQNCELRSESPRKSREASPVRSTITDRDTSLGQEIGQVLSKASIELHQSPEKNRVDAVLPKKISANPHYETPSWGIVRLFGYLSSPTSTALNYCTTLREKPINLTAVTHAMEWGINETIMNACAARDSKDKKSIDGLQCILRINHGHTINLRKMVETCSSLEMQLSEDVLTNVYKHYVREDEQDLAYTRLVIEEAQKRLQERKKDRRHIYKTKHTSGTDLETISDDEYDKDSMARHFLTYEQNNK
jgi:hypothetical protein